MQVIDKGDTATKQVIVGQQYETQEFEIANTAAMMNVLSTGLYENPLKAVVREIMFNAWDAQKDNNMAHKPIEVTVNIENGILIRDHGMGIHQDLIHSIYCVYGASTKVEVQEATGGFGFGTKAPFSYSDAFTVISYHEGVKSVNLINKVAENSNGKPGRTLMVQVPTEESGIAVNVALKNIEDVRKIIQYIENIIYLSGMKVKFTYNSSADNDPDETHVIEYSAREVKPNEMIISNQYSRATKESEGFYDEQGIYAVYGGVRYKIPDNELYEDAYKNLRIFTRNGGAVYFGFAPDTLTPQPSRDGLNLSELTLNSIREIISTTSEEVMDLADEALITGLDLLTAHVAKIENMSDLKKFYTLHRWFIAEGRVTFDDYKFNILEAIKATNGEKPGNYTWLNVLNLLNTDLRYIKDYSTFNNKQFNTRFLLALLKHFPDSKTDIFALKRLMHQNNDLAFAIQILITERRLRDLMNFELEMADFTTSERNLPKLMAMSSWGQTWYPLTRNRTKIHQKNAYSLNSKFCKKPSVPLLHKVQQLKRNEARRYEAWWDHQYVRLVKSRSRLDITQFETSIPSPSIEGVHLPHFNTPMKEVPSYIVPAAKGGYAKAKEILERMGYTVIEIVEEKYEPVQKYETVANPDDKIYLIDLYNHNWESSNIVTEADFFLKINQNKINSLECPSTGLMEAFLNLGFGSVAMCHYVYETKPLKETGARDCIDHMIEWGEQLAKDKRKMTKMVRYYKVVKNIDSNRMMKLYQTPSFLKHIGISIPSAEKDKFFREYELFFYLLADTYSRLSGVSNKLHTAMDEVIVKDKFLKRNKVFQEKMEIFTEFEMARIMLRMPNIPNGETYETLARNVLKFIKTL